MNKTFNIAIFLLLTVVPLGAQNQELLTLLQEDPTRFGGNMHGYEFIDYPQTATPKGYEVFYISHYGRHGSRSSWGEPQYHYLDSVLTSFHQADNLTATGKELLEKTKQVLAQHNGMTGRLTDKGEREHTQLAQRMYNRWPEVFQKGNKQIRAICSTVPRCLISMCAFTNQLTRLDKDLSYNFDVGSLFQAYIDCAGKIDDAPQWKIIDSLTAIIADDTTEVFEKLFLRPQQAHATCPADKLQDAIYETCIVMQDFDIPANILDYMALQAAYKREVHLALNICVRFGNIPTVAPQRRKFVQRGLNDFIQKADEAIHQGNYCIDLRFGHDFPLLAMMAGMEISGVGTSLSPEQVEYRWYCFQNLCMGSNIQMAFYRPKKGKNYKDEDILVKILYNEKERSVAGLTPVEGVYYRWSDLKEKWTGNVPADYSKWEASF